MSEVTSCTPTQDITDNDVTDTVNDATSTVNDATSTVKDTLSQATVVKAEVSIAPDADEPTTENVDGRDTIISAEVAQGSPSTDDTPASINESVQIVSGELEREVLSAPKDLVPLPSDQIEQDTASECLNESEVVEPTEQVDEVTDEFREEMRTLEAAFTDRYTSTAFLAYCDRKVIEPPCLNDWQDNRNNRKRWGDNSRNNYDNKRTQNYRGNQSSNQYDQRNSYGQQRSNYGNSNYGNSNYGNNNYGNNNNGGRNNQYTDNRDNYQNRNRNSGY